MFVCSECGSQSAAAGPCAVHGIARVDAAGDPMLGQLVGSYRVAARIGRGGMGQIYKGVHPTIASRVAIKVLSADAVERPDLVERFFAEARAVNHIRHRNIVSTFDLGKLPDGRPYILMELLEGASLEALVRARGPLPVAEVARVALQVLAALGAAHAAGVVHRDIKPDNVFVGHDGVVKVLDFGIAKLRPEVGQGSPTTRAGAMLGTPHFMSPEQIVGRPVDGRADLYAVAATLFAAVAGRPPFDSSKLFELLRLHVEEAPPSLRTIRPDVPPAFEGAILAGLAKDPVSRPPTAAAFASMLAAASGVSLPDPSLPPVALVAPPARRTPWAAITAAVAALAVAGSAGGWWLATRPASGRSPKKSARTATTSTDATGGEITPVTVPPLPAGGSNFQPGFPPFDDRRLDLDWFLGQAQAMAVQRLGKEPQIIDLQIEGAALDGTIDLTLGLFQLVQAEFRSPERAECLHIQIIGTMMRQASTVSGRTCTRPAMSMPRCRVRDVLERARAHTGAAPGSIASVHLDGRTNKWGVSFGFSASVTLDDDCPKP
jgi:serine/threonine protein kinase